MKEINYFSANPIAKVNLIQCKFKFSFDSAIDLYFDFFSTISISNSLKKLTTTGT